MIDLTAKVKGERTLTRDFVRDKFKWHLCYAVIEKEDILSLRRAVNSEMKKSGLFNGTYVCKPHVSFKKQGEILSAQIKCDAFYFKGREAVTFNKDGFIGFAGWASDESVRPILRGFMFWLHTKIGSEAYE